MKPSPTQSPVTLKTAIARVLIMVSFTMGWVHSAPGAEKLTSVAAGITEPLLDVTLSAPVPGIVSAQRFREGDFVKEGQVIVELDKQLEELETTRRRLVRDNRKSDFEATQVLFQKTKGVSKEELEKKEVEYRLASVEYQIAEEQFRRRLVTAPFSGTITEFSLDVGEACQPYEPVVRLVDTRQCYFVSNIEAKMAAGLKLDQTVKLEIQAGAVPVTVRGRIFFISPVVDPGSGLLKVKVLFDNADGKIRPGVAGEMSFD